MAQRSSSGRGGTATRTGRQAGNQTPNTPQISEAAISRMKVDEIRGQLRRHGVAGVSALRKPELVKTLAKALRAARRSGAAARPSTGPAGRAAGPRASAGRAAATKKAAGRTTKTTPARAKAAPANKMAPARKAAAKKTAAGRGAPAKKTVAVKKAAPARTAATTSRSGPSQATAIRTGRTTSRSVRSSQVISSPADRPERPGRSLVTTNHEVIRRWAQQRGAKPATITGTERGGRAGVLTFNMPGYRESSRVREITWDEWFRTFDERKLNLIYQEQLRDGRPSNFFRTESPDREDA